MADYAPTLFDQTVALTLEANLADWVEQNRPVLLPDDEYPHADSHSAIGRHLR